MAKSSKRYKQIIAEKENKRYSLADAVAFLKKHAVCKFDETVDIALNLNLDPRKAEQQIRGMVSLPEGTGKKIVVAVFARGDAADKARAAGADIVGADDLAEEIQQNGANFDVCIASPDMMGVVGKIGKILGPRGLMPNPKLGTVTMNVEAAVKSAKAGQVEYRLDKAGTVHAGICKVSFPAEKIISNLKEFISAVLKAKPTGAKGTYVKNVTLSTTMGIGIPLDLTEIHSF